MSRERPEHTWQPSALVNELYMELVKSHQLRVSGNEARDEKAAFFGLASHIMWLPLFVREIRRRRDHQSQASQADRRPL